MKIIINPKFEGVTSFHKGKAIISKSCKITPIGDHSKERSCFHFNITCKKYGYINDKGKIEKIGEYTFNQIKKEINWKSPEE